MSNQSPEEIQAEIEQQREQLAGTLDALSAKLDVKSQAKVKVAEVKADVRDRTTDDSGRPRAELIVLGATVVVVAVALVWWRRR
jgi:cobalamin biosynthesis Mg chelatase CobN